MVRRITFAILSVAASWALLALAYAMTAHPHPVRDLVAIVILEPAAIAFAVAGVLFLVPRWGSRAKAMFTGRPLKRVS